MNNLLTKTKSEHLKKRKITENFSFCVHHRSDGEHFYKPIVQKFTMSKNVKKTRKKTRKTPKNVKKQKKMKKKN